MVNIPQGKNGTNYHPTTVASCERLLSCNQIIVLQWSGIVGEIVIQTDLPGIDMLFDAGCLL
jgi:hypothetical protein